MDQHSIERAAQLLVRARQTGDLVDRLPEASRPRTTAEAYAIQEAVVALLGDASAGWKVAVLGDFGLCLGILLRSRMLASGAAVPAAQAPMLGVEAEIAFRFDRALPPRARAFDRSEVEAAVTAFAAIEIVDSRFRSYAGTPSIERAADFMSNGGFVTGTIRPDWKTIELAALEATLLIDGVEIVRQTGGHVTVDPLLPAIDLVNALRLQGGVAAGQVVTTGTYTGLRYAKPGSLVRAEFTGFGSAEVRFEA